MPDAEHPDDGTGYVGKDGRIHYFIGSWNAWVTEQWTRKAIPSLARAYALTGDERYAEWLEPAYLERFPELTLESEGM